MASVFWTLCWQAFITCAAAWKCVDKCSDTTCWLRPMDKYLKGQQFSRSEQNKCFYAVSIPRTWLSWWERVDKNWSVGGSKDNGCAQVATWNGGLSTRCFGLTRIGPGLISHMVHPIPAILNLCLPPGALQPIQAQQMVIIKVIASWLWIQQLTKG